MSDAPPIHAGLDAIAARHGHLILDVWGVLHDGVRAYPDAVATLKHLRAAGTRTLVLSNAPREVAVVRDHLRALGIADELYDMLMSSGEDVRRHLRDRPDAWYTDLGRRLYHIGPPKDRGVHAGLDVEPVADVDSADVVLVTGPPEPAKGIAPWDGVLRRAAARDLPLICANPDVVVMRGDQREMCAGALAQHYEALGGEVRYHGKPTPGIYRTCFELLGEPDPGDVAAVGDSLATDISGANAAGLTSVLVTGGIHAGALGVRMGEAPEPDRLAALCSEHGIRPGAAIPALRITGHSAGAVAS